MTKRVKGRMKTLMNSRDKILRKARKSKRECDWSSYRRLRNSCNNKIKQAKQNYYKNLLLENCKKPQKFWKYIKDIFPIKEQPPVSATTSVNETKNYRAANILCEFFTKTAGTHKNQAFKLIDFVWEVPSTLDLPQNSFAFGYVSKVFVEKELRGL